MSYTQICGIGIQESPESSRNDDQIDITIGVFFDGTCNNKYNSDKGGKGDSYRGSHTNVSHLWNGYYDEQSLINKVYIEGIGTESPVPIDKNKILQKQWKKGEVGIEDEQLKSSGGADDMYEGSGFGFGTNGINAKIEKGCKQVKQKIDKILKRSEFKEATVRQIIIDVFGFSRGAAAARSFVSRLEARAGTINEGKMVCLKEDFLKNTPLEDVAINVRFMGLFDTVSSYNKGFCLSPDFANDVEELALNIPNNVEKVVHLVAANEYRKNFALTTIASAKKIGIEIVLPGAHSDIGGGYPAVEREKLCMNVFMRERSWRGYLNFDEIVNQRWISKETLLKFAIKAKEINRKSSIRGNRANTDAEWLLRSEDRIVRNDYAKIPLKIMHKYASKVSFIKFKEDVALDWNNIVPDLSALKERIEVLADEGKGLYKITSNGIQPSNQEKEDEELILNARAEYIHLSAHNNGLANYWGGVYAATDDNRRIIIFG